MNLGERIKKVRKALDLTQQDFCHKIGLKRNSISLVESGKRNISDQAIKSICREFNVTETWLRTGEGEMFVPEPEFDLGKYVKRHGMTDLETEILKAYLELAPDVRENLLQHFKERLTRPAETRVTLPTHPEADKGGQEQPRYHVPTDEEIEREVEDFRRRLLLEKRQSDGSSPLSADSEKMS